MAGRSTAKYLHRLDLGSRGVVYASADGTQVHASEQEVNSMMKSSFSYCHHQSHHAESFAMQNKLSISGIVEESSIGVEHAHQYATSRDEALQASAGASPAEMHYASRSEGYAHTLQAGPGASSAEMHYASRSEGYAHTLQAGQMLLNYMEITVLCFVINGAKEPQYLHIPTSGVINRAVTVDDLKRLAKVYTLAAESWDVVALEHGVPTSTLAEIQSSMVPAELKMNVPPPLMETVVNIAWASVPSKVMDLCGGHQVNGNNIFIWDRYTSQSNQQWIFTPDQRIVLACNQNFCIDLHNGDCRDGANIHLWDRLGDEHQDARNQRWIFQNGQILLAWDPSWCIELGGGNTNNGSNIHLWKTSRADWVNTVWRLEPAW